MNLSECSVAMHVRRPQWKEGLWLVNVDGRWEYNQGGRPSQETQLAQDFYELHPHRDIIIAWLNNQAIKFYDRGGVLKTVMDVINFPKIKFTQRYTEPKYEVKIQINGHWFDSDDSFTAAEIQDMTARGIHVERLRQCS